MEKNLIDIIEKSGIVGAGGAGFPTHVKMNAKAEYVIINGAECEPLLRVDQQLMAVETKKILDALKLCMEAVGADKGVIALKGHYEAAINSFNQLLGEYEGISLHLLPNFYPAGDEQITVYEVTGRIVPEGGIPLQCGVIVSNVETMLNIYNAYFEDKPVTDSYVTFAGEVKNHITLKLPLGMTVKEALDLAGGVTVNGPYVVINGGPMMGKLYTKEEAKNLVVTKTTSGFVVLPEDTELIHKKSVPVALSLKLAKTSCIQCSYCTQMCPRYLTGHPLKPHMIMRKLAFCEDPETLLSDKDVQQAMICSECGLCENYACPMGIYPRQVNLYMKGLLRKQGFRYQKPTEPLQQLPEREYRRVSSHRIATRLGVDAYYDYKITECLELQPEQVSIPLSQHIGAPCVPVVVAGQTISEGALVGQMPENSLGARIHASIEGIVTEVTDRFVVIKKGGGQ